MDEIYLEFWKVTDQLEEPLMKWNAVADRADGPAKLPIVEIKDELSGVRLAYWYVDASKLVLVEPNRPKIRVGTAEETIKPSEAVAARSRRR
jgi:hypothetical protein